jgi:hypothetical protein
VRAACQSSTTRTLVQLRNPLRRIGLAGCEGVVLVRLVLAFMVV